MATSSWGYQHTTLEDPKAIIDSPWGRARTTISAPLAPVDGSWGITAARVRAPHTPIGVFTATGIVYVPVLVWDGTQWQ